VLGVGGAGAGGFALGGSVTLNEISNTVVASVTGNTNMTAGTAINILAADLSDIDNLAGGVAGAGGAAIGAAVATNDIDNSVSAYVSGVAVDLTAGNVSIDAIESAQIEAWTIGGAGAVVFAAGGAVSLNEINNTVDAYVGGGASIGASNNISVSAADISIIESKAGAIAGAGAAAIGASVATNDIGNNISAYVDNASLVSTSGTISIDASETATIDTFTLGGAGAFFFALGGAVTTANVDNTISAYAANGAALTAGDDITIDAESTYDLDVGALGAAGAIVGVGAGVVNANLNSDTNAYITTGSTLSASDDVSIRADANVIRFDTDVYVGSGGVVGINAAYAGIDSNNDANAYIASGATIVSADQIDVVAESSTNIDARVYGINGGVVAIGASVANVNDTGSANAYLGNGTVIDNGIGSLAINADVVSNISAQTWAASGGVVSVSGSVALVNVDPTSTAYIGSGSQISLTGDLELSATATPKAEASAFGVNAGGVAVGVSAATANVNANIDAHIGAGSLITAANIFVQSALFLPTDGYTAEADAFGASGALIGINGSVTDARNDSTVTSYIGNNAAISASGTTRVSSISNTRQYADSSNAVLGIVAAGAAVADATANTSTTAYLGSGAMLTGGSLEITATSVDDNYAETTAGSGGVVAGAAAIPTTSNTSTTIAEIRDTIVGPTIDLTGSGSGQLTIAASHTAKFNQRVSTNAYGVLSGSGAISRNDINSLVKASVGDNVNVRARAINMTATNRADKPLLGGGNSDSSTGGLASSAGSDSDTRISFNTLVTVGNDASMEAVGLQSNNEIFELRALNILDVKDRISLNTGGAIAGAGASSEIRTLVDLAKVEIGNNVRLKSSGAIDMSARGSGDVAALVSVDTYGLGTVSSGKTLVDLKPVNEIMIGVGANVIAYGDLNLSAGRSANFVSDFYKVESRYDGFAGSLIPLGSADAVALLVQDNRITVSSDALLQTARKARLHAEWLGLNDLDVKAKNVSWASEAQDFLYNLLGGTAELDEGLLHSEARGIVQMDGTVQTGILRNQELILTNWDFEAGTITGYTASDGVTFTVVAKELESDLLKDLDFARLQIDTYGRENQTLREFYEGEITRIQAELLSLGLMENPEGSTDPNYLVSVSQEVLTVIVDPIYAEAGSIDVRADQTQGTGLWDAPGDASVTIYNDTPAFLELKGISIPETNGGLFVNSIEVTDNSAIYSQNVNAAAEDNKFNVNEGNIAVGNAAFSITAAGSTNPPQIIVENRLNMNTVETGGETVPWPDITVLGPQDGGTGIHNLSGDVTLATFGLGDGDIIIQGAVRANNLTVVAGGSVFIEGITQYNVEGDPYSIWGPATTGPYGAGNTTAWGVKGATLAQQNATFALPPTEPFSLYGDKIFIRAEYLNINGIIQSGKEDYVLTMGTETTAEINAKLNAGISGTRIYLETASNSDFAVFFNATTGQIVVDEMRVSGGYVDIEGRILNTGNGEIRVLGGYGNIKVTNNTDFDMVINRLDASQRGAGTLIIKDKARGTAASPLVTVYRKDETGVTVTVDDGSGPVVNSGSDYSDYTIADGWRYGWNVGVTQDVIKTKEIKESVWFGFIPGGGDIDRWDTIIVQGEPTLTDEGPYFYRDTADTSQYGYSKQTISLSNTGPYKVHDNVHKKKIKLGPFSVTYKKTYHIIWKEKEGQRIIHNQNVEADRDLGIRFIGGDEGQVAVNSTGDGRVIIAGSILNPTGETSINSRSSIETIGTAGVITGRNIALTAQSDIGNSVRALQTNVTESPYGGLSATSATGDITIDEIIGDLVVDNITAASGGDVYLSTRMGIFVGQQSSSAWYEGLVAGGAITLIADNGSIGNSSLRPLVLDSSNGTVVQLKDTVNISTPGDVFISEKTGDLRIEKIDAGGNAWIEVVSGNIIDANQEETRDERTIEELQGGLWSQLRLTESTGALQKIDDTISAFSRAKEQEYRTYWQFRSTQPDPSIYDANFQVSLTAIEDAYYRNQLAYDQAAIDTLENSRTIQYHVLHAEFGIYGDSFDPSFVYSLSVEEETALRGSIKVWTEEELLYTVSAGLLKGVSDTTINIEDSNILASSITLNVGGGIGETEGYINIDLTSLSSLTTDERVLLAAAERDDVIFVSGAPKTLVVDFAGSALSGTTITRTDGDSLSGLEAGDFIQVLGNTYNATEGQTFFEIASISGDVITLVANTAVVPETGAQVKITQVIPDPESNSADITAIQISLREDVDIGTAGLVNVSADDRVFIGSELDIFIDQIIVGDAINGADIRIKSGQNIINAAGPGITNIRGGDLILEAAQGSIGTADTVFYTDLVGDGTFTARALNDVYVHERTPSGTAGDMRVGTVFSRNGGIYLEADGSIVDGLNNDFANMAAQNIVLLADGGIGEPGDYLDMDAFGAGLLTATANENIRIAETFGNMNVRNVISRTGDVDLKAHLFILDAVDLTDPTNPDSSINVGPDSNPLADVIGNSITLISEFGGIGLSGNNFDIDSAYSGAGTLTSSSNLANTYIIETSSNSTLPQDLSLFEVSTSPGETAFIAAPLGRILNGNPGGRNVISGKTYLFAAQDIGEALNPITTQVGNIEGLSTTGSTWVTNAGGLNVGGVIGTSNGMVAGGAVYVSASSPVTVTEDIVAENGEIVVVAQDDASDSDWYGTDTPDNPADDGDHIRVLSGRTIWSQNSYVKLLAGDDLIIESGARIRANDLVVLYGDFQGDIMGNPPLPGYINVDDYGTTITLNGGIDAPEIQLYGDSDNDVFNFDIDYPVNELRGHVQAFGGNGDDQFNVIRLHSRDETLDLDGQGGTDSYTINFTGGSTDYIVNVLDTGDASDGMDLLTLNATDAADTLLLRKDFVAKLNDSNNDGEFDAVERVNYNSNINNRLQIFGYGGDDVFSLDDNSAETLIDSGTGNDSFQVGQIFESPRDAAANIAPGDEFDTTLTTRGYLSNGISYRTTLEGGDGNDEFTVYHNSAELDLLGGSGDDIFTVRAFALEGSQLSTISGGQGADQVEYVINAPIDIQGGDGVDTVRVIGTEFGDQFVVTASGIFGAGLTVTYSGIERLELDAAEGDDEIYILSTSAMVETSIFGGLGSDRISVAGDAPEVISEGGTRTAEAGTHLAGTIQGVLNIDGAAGEGSAGGLVEPVMLPGETNAHQSDGNVLDYTGAGLAGAIDRMILNTVDLEIVASRLGLANINALASRTLEVNAGPGLGRFWKIDSIASGPLAGTTELVLKNAALPAGEWELPNASSEFAITNLADSFFVDENLSIDRVLVFNDASVADNTGVLTATYISGLGFANPVNYSNLEGLEIMLGSGDDSFTVDSTASGTVSAIYAGGGSDTVTVTGGGGANSPLLIFGDTTNNGEPYSGTPGVITPWKAYSFGNPGNDVIDASASVAGVSIYGGAGDDIITGSQGDDRIAGGAGDDTIYAEAGNDQIYGDSGFNLDMAILELTVPTNEAVGADLIYGGSGDDIIFGDHGIVDQYGGGVRIDTTDGVTHIETANVTQGADDQLFGGTGNDKILGGNGADIIDGNTGDDIIIGDNGSADFSQVTGTAVLEQIQTTDPTIGGADIITAAEGSDTIFGGQGGDYINAWGTDVAADLVVGDHGIATYTNGVLTRIESLDPSYGGNDNITTGAGANVVFGGIGEDIIEAGGDASPDIILGDNGFATFTDSGVITLVETRDPEYGGDDIITAGDGPNVLVGGSGADSITAGNAETADIILGDNGRIVFTNGILNFIESSDPAYGGNDTIIAGNGPDVVLGGSADDLILAGGNDAVADVVLGDNGYATFTPAGVITEIYSSAYAFGGRDIITTGDGADVIIGGSDNDIVLAAGGETSANAVLDILATNPDITPELVAAIIATGAGDAAADVVIGDSGRALFTGGNLTFIETRAPEFGGNDIITGGNGADIVLGGSASDVILSGGNDTAADVLLGDNGFARFTQDGVLIEISSNAANLGGQDIITGGDGADAIIGGSDNDIILAAGNDAAAIQVLQYLGANDVITPDIVADMIATGSGDGAGDVVLGDSGRAVFVNGNLSYIETSDPEYGGEDVISAGNGRDVVLGGSANDVILAGGDDAATDVVLGDNGWATFNSAGQLSEIVTNAPHLGGNDIITTGNGPDVVMGGAADDIILSAGNDAAAMIVLDLLASNPDLTPDVIQQIVAVGVGDNAGDVVLGDGGRAVFTDGELTYIESRDPVFGGDDVIVTGNGPDMVLGGSGEDAIFAGGTDNAKDIVMGDNGRATFGGTETFAPGEESSVLSFNFTGDHDHHEDHDNDHSHTLVTGIAGAPEVATGNWNNLDGGGGRLSGSDSDGLAFDDGSRAFGINIEWGVNLNNTPSNDERNSASQDNHNQINPNGDQDLSLFDGYLTTSNKNTLGVKISGLAAYYQTYDVYVYLDADDKKSASGASVRKISNGASSYFLNDADGNTFEGTYVEVNSTDPLAPQTGNYVVFRGLTGDIVSITVDADNNLDGSRKNYPAINGIQVQGQNHPIDRIETTYPGIGGDDTIFTGGGEDIVFGGAGDDFIDSQGAAVAGRWDADLVAGDNASATLVFGDVREVHTTFSDIIGHDTIITGNGEDVVLGGSGNDIIDTSARGPYDNGDVQVISINFGNGHQEANVTGVAGAVQADNWNNLTGTGHPHHDHDDGDDGHSSDSHAPDTASNIVFADGSIADNVQVTWGRDLDTSKARHADVASNDQIDPDTRNESLYEGFLYTDSGYTLGVNVSGLNNYFDTYDVYVYLDADNDTSNEHRSTRSITDGSTVFYLDDADGNTFAGTFVEVDATMLAGAQQGNYVVFRNVSGDVASIRVESEPGKSNDEKHSDKHNLPAVSGMQIVGGADKDSIIIGGDYDRDVVVGDMGQVRFLEGFVYEVQSTQSGNVMAGIDSDTIITGEDRDLIIGGNGDDVIDSGAGNDVLLGDNARIDVYIDGEHEYRHQNHQGHDHQYKGNDYESNGHGHHDNDHEHHGSEFEETGITLLDNEIGGNDRLTGGEGNDLMYGQFGNDTYVFAGSNLGKDTAFEFGDVIEHHHDHGHEYGYKFEKDDDHQNLAAGPNDLHDVLDFSDFTGPVNTDLQGGHVTDLVDMHDHHDEDKHEHSSNLDLLLVSPGGFEDVIGSDFADVINGNRRNNTLLGGDGDDQINGNSGDDLLMGGRGNDRLLGGLGADILDGGVGNDEIFGQGSHKHAHHDEHDEHDDDRDEHDKKEKKHEHSPNIIFGGAGDDTLYGGAGDDLIDGEAGNDKISGNSGNDILLGGNGDDIIHGGKGSDIIEGGPGADTLYGNTKYDVIEPEQGAGLLGLSQVFQNFTADYSLDTFYYVDPNAGNPAPVDDRPARAWIEEFIGGIVASQARNLVAADVSGYQPPRTLSEYELQAVVDEARKRWMASGVVDQEDLDQIDRLDIKITRLGGLLLGQTRGETVYIDRDAAGHGWFVDVTPGDSSEFDVMSNGELQAQASSAAYGRMDLLTVVAHEMGHALGFTHGDARKELDSMTAALDTGRRYLPDGMVDTTALEIQAGIVSKYFRETVSPLAYSGGLAFGTQTSWTQRGVTNDTNPEPRNQWEQASVLSNWHESTLSEDGLIDWSRFDSDTDIENEDETGQSWAISFVNDLAQDGEDANSSIKVELPADILNIWKRK